MSAQEALVNQERRPLLQTPRVISCLAHKAKEEDAGLAPGLHRPHLGLGEVSTFVVPPDLLVRADVVLVNEVPRFTGNQLGVRLHGLVARSVEHDVRNLGWSCCHDELHLDGRCRDICEVGAALGRVERLG